MNFLALSSEMKKPCRCFLPSGSESGTTISDKFTLPSGSLVPNRPLAFIPRISNSPLAVGAFTVSILDLEEVQEKSCVVPQFGLPSSELAHSQFAAPLTHPPFASPEHRNN